MTLHKAVKLTLILLFMAFVLVSLTARAGGAGGSSGFSGSGDGDGLIELLFYLVYFILVYVPFPFNLLLIAVILFAVLIAAKTGKLKHEQNGSAFKSRRQAMPSAGKKAVRIPVPGFDNAKFLEKVRKSFLAIQRAWMNKDISDVRHLISDGVYQRFVTQVEMMALLKQRNILEDLSVQNLWIDHFSSTNHYDVIHVGISAAIRDRFLCELSKKLNSGGYEEFTEYWTFIRKKSAKAFDLFSAEACPNCGAPLEKKATDIASCDYCGTVLNSGEYDWVLSEITQADDYAGSQRAAKKIQHLAQDIDKILAVDPDFSVQVLEDKASNGYLQLMSAQVYNEPLRVRRFVTDAYFQKFSQLSSAVSLVYNRLYLNDVTVIAIGESEGKNFAAVSVKSSFQRVLLKGEKLDTILDPYVRSDTRIMIMLRDKVPEAPKGSLYAHACPSCSAPVLDSLDIKCQYCHVPLNSSNREWIIDAVFSAAEYRAFLKEQGIETTKQVDIAVIDKLYDVKDYAFNNMMMIMAADGVFHDDERAFVLSLARKYGYRLEDIASLFQLASAGRLSLKMPLDPAKRRKVYKLMEKAAMADGHLADEEQELLDMVRQTYLS